MFVRDNEGMSEGSAMRNPSELSIHPVNKLLSNLDTVIPARAARTRVAARRVSARTCPGRARARAWAGCPWPGTTRTAPARVSAAASRTRGQRRGARRPARRRRFRRWRWWCDCWRGACCWRPATTPQRMRWARARILLGDDRMRRLGRARSIRAAMSRW